jgi:hypothetical protein
MPPTDGLLVVFLMDLRAVFNNEVLFDKAKNEGIDLFKPLIGFALGIPPIDSGLGEDYLINSQIRENEINCLDEEDDSDELEPLKDE